VAEYAVCPGCPSNWTECQEVTEIVNTITHRSRTGDEHDDATLAVRAIFRCDLDQMAQRETGEVEGTGEIHSKGEVPEIEGVRFVMCVDNFGRSTDTGAVDNATQGCVCSNRPLNGAFDRKFNLVDLCDVCLEVFDL
jgi:hypothetical protein